MIGPVIIKSVKLNNILSHVQTSIEFPLGLTALVGPNGAGKSSIIDSIVYAMFVSPQGTRMFRGSGKRGILRAGASAGSIEIELSVGGRRYVVYRAVSITRGDEATMYEILDDGRRRVVASGVQQVVDYVKRLLSIPSLDSIRYTVISRQNEVARLIEEGSSTRRELILKLLGLDELEKSKEILKEHLNQLGREKALFDSLKVELDNVRKKINNIQIAIERDEADLGKLEKEAQALEEDIKRYEHLLELLRKYSALSRAIEIVEELRKLEQVLPLCRDIANVSLDDYVSTATILRERKREIEEAVQKLNEANNKLKDLVSTISRELEISIPAEVAGDSSKVIEILEDYARRIEYEKSLKQAELSIATNSIKVIEVSTRCPLCERELGDELKSRILYDIKLRISTTSSDIKRIEQLCTKARRFIDEVKKLDRARLELQAKIDSSRKHLENYVRRYRELKDRVNNVVEIAKNSPLFSRCMSANSTTIEVLKCLNRLSIEIKKAYEEKLSTLKHLLGDITATLDSIVEEYRRVKEDISKLGFNINEVDIRKVEVEYKQLVNRFNMVKELVGSTRGRLESNRKLLDELKKTEREIENKLADLKKSIDILPLLELLVDKLLGKEGLLAKILTAEARRLMEKYTNRVLKELGMDFSVRIGDSFDISIYTNFGELDVRNLSGGEMVSLAIALRIALAYTVFGRLPGFFILDEPTQFLDFEKRRTIFEIIRRLSEKVPQVIVVTHDAEVEDLADKVFYVSKEGGKSIVRGKEKLVEYVLKE